MPPRQVLGTAFKSLDLPGFFLISPAAVMFLLGLQYGGTLHPWNSSVVIGLLVGAGVTFIVFLVWEYYQGDNAMLPFAMIKKRIVWSAAANLFFLLGAILVAEYYLAIYFQTVLDNSPIMSGVHLLPTTLGLVLFTMLSGMMSSFSTFLNILQGAIKLIFHSGNLWILPPLELGREFLGRHWLWPHVYAEAYNWVFKMAWVPSPLWCW